MHFRRLAISVIGASLCLGLFGGYVLGVLNDTSSSDEPAKVRRMAHNFPIKGLIVPHHLLAKELIIEAFRTIATEQKRTVFLISPNHFFVGRGPIISTLSDLETPDGILETDKDLISELETETILNIDEYPFRNEHGISALIPFIKEFLPNAKIVPLIVRDPYPLEKVGKFAAAIFSLLPDDALLIGSFDFSHYLPSHAADFHDIKSLAVLQDFDYDGIEFMDVDAKAGLALFLRLLELSDARSFSLINHSNSAKLLDDPTMMETTSYIIGTFEIGQTRGDSSVEELLQNDNASLPHNDSKALFQKSSVTLLAFGDMMLDRYVRRSIDLHDASHPFEPIERFLGGSDIVLVNSEGPFTDFSPKPLDPYNFTLTFDPRIIPTLKKFGFTLFNLANNHALNFGQAGLNQSRDYLRTSGLDYFGEPNNLEEISLVKKIRNLTIAFIGWNEFGKKNLDTILDEIQRLDQESDFTVVYTHWGNEYQSHFSLSQQDYAHQFIDAGADLILGSHPHVIQPLEIYEEKMIFYSLGNFLFDQTFSVSTQQGLGVGIVFGTDSINFYLFPMEIRDFQIHLMNFEQTATIFSTLSENSAVSDEMKKQILSGHIQLANLKKNVVSSRKLLEEVLE